MVTPQRAFSEVEVLSAQQVLAWVRARGPRQRGEDRGPQREWAQRGHGSWARGNEWRLRPEEVDGTGCGTDSLPGGTTQGQGWCEEGHPAYTDILG